MMAQFFQPLVILFLLVALALQFVVLRQHPLPSILQGRRLGLVGLFVAALYLLGQTLSGAVTPFPVLLFTSLMALGQIIFGLNRLEQGK